MTTVIAVIGVTALYLLFGWLLSAIASQDLSDLKGYGEKPGLATGLLLSVAGMLVWLLWPPRAGSAWDRRVKVGDLVTAVAGFVLFVSLLFEWYTTPDGSFYDEFKFYDVLLPLGAAIGYAQLHMRGRPDVPGWLSAVVFAAPVLSLLTIAVQFADKPDGSSLSFGIFVATGAAVVMLAGAVLAMSTDRTQTGASTMAEARAESAEAS
jgi:hypothetical protein